MIGTAAARTFSRNSPTIGVSLEQVDLGSSHRAFRSRTKRAVVLPSRLTGLGSGRFGPSCAEASKTSSVAKTKARADLAIMTFSSLRQLFLAQLKSRNNAKKFQPGLDSFVAQTLRD